jgi:hypothetical protein
MADQIVFIMRLVFMAVVAIGMLVAITEDADE